MLREMNEDDKDKSDKDYEGNSMDIMPENKVRKFVPNENDHKEP